MGNGHLVLKKGHFSTHIEFFFGTLVGSAVFGVFSALVNTIKEKSVKSERQKKDDSHSPTINFTAWLII